jgi:hypothetical protein
VPPPPPPPPPAAKAPAAKPGEAGKKSIVPTGGAKSLSEVRLRKVPTAGTHAAEAPVHRPTTHEAPHRATHHE